MSTESKQAFSIEEALRFGWTATRANLKPLLLLGLAGAFLGMLNQALASPAPNNGLRGLMLLFIQVLQAALVMVWLRTALLLHDGQKFEWPRLSSLVGDFLTFLLTWVLYGLLVGVGLVLLLVPGIIWGLMFGFSGYLVVDKKLDPIEAFRESNRLTRGVKGRLLELALVLLGVNILGAIALGVGLFITIPTTFIAGAYVFRRLQARVARKLPPALQAPLSTPTPSGAA